MSQYLQDKVVVVTGAATGFGRLIAEKCAAGGARVLGVDVDEARLTEVFGRIGAAGAHRAADVTDLEQMLLQEVGPA